MNDAQRSAAPGFGAGLLSLWGLDPALCHLNHGAFGATPHAVLEAQERWRSLIEVNPTHFYRHEISDALREAATKVADFLGGIGESWVFVDNATAGANAVLGSIDLTPGDEVLIADQAYGAVRNAVVHHATRAGAKVETFALPCPVEAPSTVVEAVEAALSDNTRLVLIDHITSPTAMVLPVADVVAQCRRHDVAVLVDGAHVPGNLAVDVPSLEADWYVGNLHKWAFAPRSCGVLWASNERREDLHPPVISWGYGKGLAAEFDWQGTRDPSAWLSASDAIVFGVEFGWDRLRTRNRALALEGSAMIAEALGTERSAPPEMIGSMAAIRLPLMTQDAKSQSTVLQQRLLERQGVMVSVTPAAEALWLRICAQVYNEEADCDRLIDALRTELRS